MRYQAAASSTSSLSEPLLRCGRFPARAQRREDLMSDQRTRRINPEPGPQPDPLLRTSMRSAGWNALIALAIIFIMFVTFYGMNNSEQQQTASAPAPTTAQSAPASTTGQSNAAQAQQEQAQPQQSQQSQDQQTQGAAPAPASTDEQKPQDTK
jgi:hypothetical protein